MYPIQPTIAEVYLTQSIVLTALRDAERGKPDPCPGAPGLGEEAHSRFSTEEMKKVQSDYKLYTEEKGAGKATQGPYIPSEPEENFTKRRGGKCFSPLTLRSLREE